MKKIKKEIKRQILNARGAGKVKFGGDEKVKNVYHACIQKTGSQWIKSVFGDTDVVKNTGLRVHPQFRYEIGEFKKSFPKYTFVPGLYIPYELYREIKKPDKHKTIYVIRDPREVVVSWYYSMRYTHSLMGTVRYHRRKLKQLGESEGIEYCIKHLQWKFSFVRSWWQGCEDSRVLTVRFENLTRNPIQEWKKIFEHCGIKIDKSKLKAVLDRYTKEKMRKKDMKKRKEKSRSHYRKDKKSWDELFKSRHIEIFRKINGDIVDRLGYEW